MGEQLEQPSADPTWAILCLNGPNLNLLGVREPERYGTMTLAELNQELEALGRDLGASVSCRQSNHEGELIDWLDQSRGRIDALLINPAGLTHTSVALRDAVLAVDVPSYEVHITNVYQREPFRHTSLFADVCRSRLMGFGPFGYMLALRGAIHDLQVARRRANT